MHVRFSAVAKLNVLIVAFYGNVPESIDLFAFRAHLETWQKCRPVGRRSFVQLLRMKCRLLQMKSFAFEVLV